MADKTPTFRDAKDREWSLRLTVGNCREIRDTCHIDFGEITDGKCFVELGTSIEKLYQVLWVLCEKQAESRSVTPEDFAESFDGDVLDDAQDALMEAVTLFTRRSMRTAMEKMIRATTKAVPEGMKTLEAWIEANDETLMANVRKETEATLSENMEKILSTSGKR